VPIPLEKIKLDSGKVDLSIKSDTADFNIKKGQSSSFYFQYQPPKYQCNIRLEIYYTDPNTGERASFIQRLDI
jgi:hypothetical protein